MEQQVQKLQQENELLLTDLKIVKGCLIKILEVAGMFNHDGTMREKMDMKAVLKIAMQATTNPKKLKEDFAFLSSILPLVEKYKDL